MTTSVPTFRREFTEGLLNFVWCHWCRMGVAGSSGGQARWVIDPEPLLAFTAEVARHDARLFDQVLDWLDTNGHWINAQRLSTIMRSGDIGDATVIGACACWMAERDKSAKWRGVARTFLPPARKPAEPLFHAPPSPWPALPDQQSPPFQRYSLLRGPICLRKMTQPINLKDPANLLFKCRAVFGIGIRADLTAYLATTKGGHARQIASVLGYNHARISEVLSDMAEAGMVTMHSTKQTKLYRLDQEPWHAFLATDRADSLPWMNWRSLTRGLTTLWRAVWSIDEQRADDYIFSSEMRKAMRTAKDDLLNSGLAFAIEDDQGFLAESYLPVFHANIRALLAAMT